MNLIFDCRFIRVHHHDGISRFSSELFRAVSKLVPTTALISDMRQLRFLPEGVKYILGSDPMNVISELFIAKVLNKAQPTHVFSPMQTMGSWGRRYKLVLTLHDLIYYTHKTAPPSLPLPVRIAWRIYHFNFWAARLLLNRADAVATVSATSKEQIQQRRLTNKPVHVVYNAADSDSSATTSPTTPPITRTVNGRRQLVYMGSFMPYKNVECLIEAIKGLEEFDLVLLSNISTERKQQLEMQAGEAIGRVRFVNGVSDQEYLNALDGAFALVSASKDEGFGIPLVEAMSRGIPVVVSDIPIFREVGAEAGRYFDPESSSQLASAILDLQDASAWTMASEQSLERSAFFNWDDSARALVRALG